MNELREKMLDHYAPHSHIYSNLETISECYQYFSINLGSHQYYPEGADQLAENRMSTQYHAQYPEAERNRIIENLVTDQSNLRVLFVPLHLALASTANT